MTLSKETIANSKRLSNLEKEMALKVALKQNRISVEDLKDEFYRKASIKTTKAIVTASDNFIIDSQNMVSLFYSNDKYATVEYKSSGSIDTIYIGGESGNRTGDTIYDVSVTPDDLFLLEIEPTNQMPWTFETVKVEITEDTITRTRSFGVNLKDKSGKFEDRV